MLRHSCHQCPEREDHARWAERYWKLKRTVDKQRREIDNRTGTVARIFDRVVDVLTELDYVKVTADGATELTPAGRTMRRIYGERDLLVAESLRTGIWRELDAAVPRDAGVLPRVRAAPGRIRSGGAGAAPRSVPRRSHGHSGPLGAAGRPREGPPPAGHRGRSRRGWPQAMHSWARGMPLERVLIEADMAAGDFVRWAKQTIDLLDQLSLVADAPLATTARKALDAVRRGIVAYSSV